MGKEVFKGFKLIDGTEGTERETFENGIVYFIRTDEDKENGYIQFNGKKYGVIEPVIDCGTF